MSQISTLRLLVLIFFTFNLGTLNYFLFCRANDGALIVSDMQLDVDDEEVSTEVSKDGENSDVFVPTSEWQHVKEGQSIPRGLHVRLNMATGEREAKLNEKNSIQDKNSERIADGNKRHHTHAELKKALKEFKADMDDVKNPMENTGKTNDFRSYEEIKEEFAKLNWMMKTEAEIITGLVQEYRNITTSESRKLAIFEDLEYYLHQVDNAQLFVDLNALSIAKEALNSSNSQLKSISALLLGSAAQSNPKVQIAMIEAGILQDLVRYFSNEPDESIQKRLLFALSAIVRNFPYAQKKFVELGGLETMLKFSQNFQTSPKIRMKIVTLLYDMLQERFDVEQKDNKEATVARSSIPIEKWKQYQETPIVDFLISKGFCSVLAELLELPDVDSQEKVLKTLQLLHSHCTSQLISISNRLQELKENYAQELKDEENREYFQFLLEKIHGLLNLPQKDEL